MSEDTCPHCGADLRGEPIPEAIKSNYSATHWSRKLGKYDRDKTAEWMCPDCEKTWSADENKN